MADTPENDLAKRAGDVSQPGTRQPTDIPKHGNQTTETRGAPVSVERHPTPETKEKE